MAANRSDGEWSMYIEGGKIVSSPEQGVWKLDFAKGDVSVKAEVAGLEPTGRGGIPVNPDVQQLDILIEFLSNVRNGTAKNSEAAAERESIVSSLTGELADATDEQLKTILLMVEMIKSGDMTVDFIHGDSDRPSSLFN